MRAQWALVALISACVSAWSENGKSAACQLYCQNETGRVTSAEDISVTKSPIYSWRGEIRWNWYPMERLHLRSVKGNPDKANALADLEPSTPLISCLAT